MKNSIKLFHWLPRILCILAIVFVSLFALDAFNDKLPILEQIKDFIIHLVPSFVLIILLIIAWKWEKIGGIIFLVLGLGFSPFLFMKNYKMNQSIAMSSVVILIICVPFIIVGILFLISYYKKRKTDKIKS